MARRKSTTLTQVELEFMQVLWGAPEWSTEEMDQALRRQGRQLTGGSIRKILSILIEKGYVTRRPQGNGFLYQAAVPAHAARKGMVADLLDRAFGGSAGLLVAALLDTRKVPPRELGEIRRLIAERERGGQNDAPSRAKGPRPRKG